MNEAMMNCYHACGVSGYSWVYIDSTYGHMHKCHTFFLYSCHGTYIYYESDVFCTCMLHHWLISLKTWLPGLCIVYILTTSQFDTSLKSLLLIAI